MNELSTLQGTLEELFDKHRQLPFLRAEVAKIEWVQAIIDEDGLDEKFVIDLMAQMVLHRRCTADTLVGVLFNHFKNAQTTADMIAQCVESQLLDYDPKSLLLITAIEPDAETTAAMERFQYPLPMVLPPLKVTANDMNGYHFNRRGSVILRDNHHEDDVNLDYINLVNSMPLSFNTTVSKYMSNKWSNMERPKEGESRADYLKRLKAFQKYDRSSRGVMAMLTEHTDTFYLDHSYDTRGRSYCNGYHATYQGNSWCKAVIQFAEKEIIK